MSRERRGAARGKRATRDYPRIVEWRQEDRCFVGSAPPLIGRCGHGPTETSVLRKLQRTVDDRIRLAEAESLRLPPPGSGRFSGRFVLRLPAAVHQALALEARAEGKRLNSYCAEKLAGS